MTSDFPPAYDPETAPRRHSELSVKIVILLGCYFGLHLAMRSLVSSSVDLDEAEAVVLAQTFSFGYGSEPPLYTWLQKSVFSVFGESVFSLSLLKNCLLFSNCVLVLATARIVTRNNAAATAACLSLFFLPTIAWESQRDLTHSVLSCTCSVATLLTLLKAHESGRTRWYALLGLSMGLGLISKYNYGLWLAGLLGAGLTLPEFRGAIKNRRFLLSALIAVAIFVPNALWLLKHQELALRSAGKFEVINTNSWGAVSAVGMKGLVQSVLAFAAPIAGVYLLLFLKPAVSELPKPNRVYQALLVRTWAGIGVSLLFAVLFARVTGFKERWFQPILVALPIYAISLVQTRLTPLRLKWLTAVAVVVMVIVAIVMPGRLFAAERLKREEPLERPYRALADQLRREVPPGSLLVCDTRLLAGNLRLGLRIARVTTPELSPILGVAHDRCFVVWDARKSDEIPESLRRWADKQNRLKKNDHEAARFFTATYLFHSSKQFRLGLLQLY